MSNPQNGEKNSIIKSYNDRFFRTAKYDLNWLLANEMGPNPLWLLEGLTEKMSVSRDHRVLDLGCGRALTSIFLAREFQARVLANDLWVSADDNWNRVQEAALTDRVFPIRAEAHNLPYAAKFFDSVVSIDAYQYFGTDDLYLGYISRFVKDGGEIGLVMPALMQEIEEPPPHLTKLRAAEGASPSGDAFWDPAECWCFHTIEWWRRHFTRPGLVDVETAEVVEEGWKLWRDWEILRDGGGCTGFRSEAPTLEEDGGRYIGFVRFVLKKRPASDRPFDHSLNIRLS